MLVLQGLYPQIRYKDGKRRFWNPVYKKTLLPLPEELVRHRLLEYLLYRRKWPASRISMESGVKTAAGKGRTDLVCYNKSFSPVLLVECKAPDVSLSEATIVQAAQYNQSLKAPYIGLTNGNLTRFFEIQPHIREVSPDEIFPEEEQKSICDSDYWKARGFIGERTSEQDCDKLTKLCVSFFAGTGQDIIYVRPPVIYEHSLNHFYHVISSETTQLAWTFMSTPAHKTLFVLLKSQKNVLSSVILREISQNGRILMLQPEGIQERDSNAFDWEKSEEITAEELLKMIADVSHI